MDSVVEMSEWKLHSNELEFRKFISLQIYRKLSRQISGILRIVDCRTLTDRPGVGSIFIVGVKQTTSSGNDSVFCLNMKME